MATNTNLFTDKETNNWCKASIALNVTKQGLTEFLDKALQNVYAAVGRSCGNCPIEKLIPCPTNPYCNKKKRSYCPFHKSQIPQPCPTCDKVKRKSYYSTDTVDLPGKTLVWKGGHKTIGK
ncbi:hypothetical protein DPMN_150700 [Dreissena polymorpha]|uniref:Uncharacterized protein n=1 Tax=Dreissena polymorpha TaxID=45954 RepID=A0A9D4FE91_DREPO|nr:hypothetical protein DPMN_150700 [Dreissena polymorpha]